MALMTPNYSSQELIYFTFHSTLLISEKSENDRKRGEETHTKRGFPCLNGVEKSWMNFSSAGISPSAFANCFATGHMAEHLKGRHSGMVKNVFLHSDGTGLTHKDV